MKKIKIGIVEDHIVVRQGLMALLPKFKEIEVLFDVSNGKELLEALTTYKPNLILLDIDMPVMNGREALLKTREKFPDVKVIMLSMHYEEAYIVDFISNGASAFLPKGSNIDKVIEAMQNVYKYGHYYDETVLETLKKAANEKGSTNFRTSKVVLTEKELQILALICANKSNTEIADILFISPRTVEGHRSSLLQKTGSKNLGALTLYAITNQLLSEKHSKEG